MLADIVLENVGSAADRQFRGAITQLATQLRTAQRFLFSDTSAEAMSQVAFAKPSSLLSAVPMVRLPFPTVWLEWSERRSLHRSEATESLPMPDKFGVLLETPEEGLILASYVWLHSRASAVARGLHDESARLNLSYLSSFICPSGQFPDWVPRSKWEISDEYVQRFSGNEREWDAIKALTSLESATPCRFYGALIKTVPPLQLKQLEASAAENLVGESKRVIAAIALLNSRNAIDIVDADLSKINRKRTGTKPKRLSHSIVTIKLSSRQSASAEAQHLSDAEIREHEVRGHFKVRKSGIYWWRPFIRGRSEVGVLPRKHYRVIGEIQS
ncbi:hypothetical protein [Bradyrhizobium erythrophlei]|uniref:Uncharacterized protein n=1 Tax=Bradyrhizobium erythrophlei TaxID=1437360 RepID=A0A1H4NR22_9BRAD|nr:hypothetical protein [Bradyrhizobium erythrophlei]SEB97660.1 hypothetical protein SAMN05444164_0704 [Bradyrhizobium erythrophlei]